MAKSIRIEEFHSKFRKMEDKMEAKETALMKYIEELKEIIAVREEQMIATMGTVKEKEEIIKELQEEAERRERES